MKTIASHGIDEELERALGAKARELCIKSPNGLVLVTPAE